MIEYKKGNIFNEKVDAFVNTVNCVGVMGRGLALQFKNIFPDNFKAYASACKNKKVLPGSMFVYDIAAAVHPRFIINFPTKRHWKQKSNIKDIEDGLSDLARVITQKGITSIAIPPLGCGLGGLDWPTVRNAIEKRLANLEDVHIVLFEPEDVPMMGEMPRTNKVPAMTPGRAALISLMDRYQRGLLDPFVTPLDVHKLMYFLQAAGEPLHLIYRKASYGPYAENLHPVLNIMEGYYIYGYKNGVGALRNHLVIMQNVKNEVDFVLNYHKNTQINLDRVFQLIDGFESSFGLELLSSVHWVMKYELPQSLKILIQKIYTWNKNKKKFSERQIGLAVKVLRAQEWIGG